MMAAVMLSASIGFAQTTTGNIGKSANTALGTNGGSVKVVDNKGTIKYLQSNNGLTTFTDTAPDGGVVTTWQLGGTLTDATNIATGVNEFKITLDAGGTFVLNGALQETGIASDAGTIGASGWTLLTRDETTGQVKKLLASDLISGIRVEYTQGANATADVDIAVSGLPVLTTATTSAKLFVFRNGVKLRTGTDFVAILNQVTITYNATDLPMFGGDIIEIQYIK
jgi:hypothetical protein